MYCWYRSSGLRAPAARPTLGVFHRLEPMKKRMICCTSILKVRAPKCCPKCGHLHLVKNSFRTRDFISLPFGGKKVILRMKVRRYKCKCADCDYDCQERISFAPGSHSYTRLLKGMPLKDTAHLLGVSWGTIKEIHTHHLECHYAPPSLEGVPRSRESRPALCRDAVCTVRRLPIRSFFRR